MCVCVSLFPSRGPERRSQGALQADSERPHTAQDEVPGQLVLDMCGGIISIITNKRIKNARKRSYTPTNNGDKIDNSAVQQYYRLFNYKKKTIVCASFLDKERAFC